MFGGDNEEDDESVSAIRVLISVNESRSCRKITLKGLYGNYTAIRVFFKYFNRKIQNKLNKGVPKSERQKRKKEGKLTFDNNYNEISLITEEESKHEHPQSPLQNNNDSTNQKFTYYYYHKILSSDQYSLGKKVSEFVEQFNSKYEQAEGVLLPKPMTEA